MHDGMHIVDWKVRKTERMCLIWYHCRCKWKYLD